MTDCVDCGAIDPLVRAMDRCVETDEDDENENSASKFLHSSLRNLKRSSMTTTTSTAPTLGDGDENRLATLQHRLDRFVAKHWLTKTDYQQYTAFLSTFEKSDCLGDSGNYALQELEKELDATERKNKNRSSHKPKSWTDMITSTFLSSTTTTNDTNSNTAAAAAENNSTTTKGPLATVTNRCPQSGTALPTIAFPSELHNVLTEDAVSELFVETCFFARLGFVQPPTCLSCTYREAMKHHTPDYHCRRWVVWRIDAKQVFDPSPEKMRDNTILVQCQAARKLLAGKRVDNWQWHPHEKIVSSDRIPKSKTTF